MVVVPIEIGAQVDAQYIYEHTHMYVHTCICITIQGVSKSLGEIYARCSKA